MHRFDAEAIETILERRCLGASGTRRVAAARELDLVRKLVHCCTNNQSKQLVSIYSMATITTKCTSLLVGSRDTQRHEHGQHDGQENANAHEDDLGRRSRARQRGARCNILDAAVRARVARLAAARHGPVDRSALTIVAAVARALASAAARLDLVRATQRLLGRVHRGRDGHITRRSVVGTNCTFAASARPRVRRNDLQVV